MPKLLNMRHGLQGEEFERIDRLSPFGNPFKIGRDGNRDDVCDKFEEWIMRPEQARLRAQAKARLRGKNLACWCAPARCHGTTWLKIVNGG